MTEKNQELLDRSIKAMQDQIVAINLKLEKSPLESD